MKKLSLLAPLLLLVSLALAACDPAATPVPTPRVSLPATPAPAEPTAVEPTTAPTVVAPTAAPAAATEPIYLSIIWHQHQPVYYKNPETGVYEKPWVRLHATKDYLDMAETLKKYPNVKASFNLTPSLLRQLRDYEDGAKDLYLLASEKPAEQLTPEDKRFMLRRFFDIGSKIIAVFPRYTELQAQRGDTASDEAIDATAATWTAQDFRDLQVLFNLGWTDPDYRNAAPLDALVAKKRDFSEADKQTLLARQSEILNQVIPTHAAMQQNDQIEITFTPYAHPILPLLIDTEATKQAMPDSALPNPAFRFGQDAEMQLKRGIELYTELFNRPPAGMWPAEGSVAQSIVTMVGQNGVTWMATDEEVLAKSIGLNQFDRNADETVQEADKLYRPYTVTGANGEQVQVIFRDRTISDKVGFTYSGTPGAQAADDFIRRIENIRMQLAGTPGPHLVTVLLDGENAWEYYDNDGKDFLNSLYSKLSDSTTIKTVTPSQYLALGTANPKIDNLWSGSWISADFSTWIGEDEENKGWDLLTAARKTLQKYDTGVRETTPEKLTEARDLMMIAEGSDWFWWLGSDQDSGDDAGFDKQFRDTLIQMYTVLEAEIPAELYVPLIAARPIDPAAAAQQPLTVTIDGAAAAGEWDNAGRYDVVGGVTQRADDVIGSMYYGFDANNLYLRLDARNSWADLGTGALGIYLGTARDTAISPFSRNGSGGKTVLGFDAGHVAEISLADGLVIGNALFGIDKGAWSSDGQPIEFKQGDVIEIAIPLKLLGEFETGDAIDLRAIASRADADIQLLPNDGLAAVNVPDLGLSTALLTIADPEGDDKGPGAYSYPTDSVFQAGAFDLTNFEVAEDENNLIFKLDMRGPIENVWTSPRGISVQTFDIYINTGTGVGQKLFPGRNAVADGGWDYGLWIEGWEGGLYAAKAEGNPDQISGVEIKTIVDGPNGRVTVRLPKKALPKGDPASWKYMAAVLGQEGYPSTGVWRVRDVAPAAGQYKFGGALPGTNGTRIIDLAIPADNATTQAQALTPPRASQEASADKLAVEDLATIPMLAP